MENREIKFRAWTTIRMMYRWLTDRNWYTESIGGSLLEIAHPDDFGLYKIMEYTGLKDKNDVEIYESDILKTPTGLAVVVKDFNWVLKSVGSQAVDFETKEYFEKCEVIGNIYENPDLL